MPILGPTGRRHHRRTPAALLVALLATLLTVVLSLVGSTPAQAATAAPPASMASLGDSITRGFDACGWYVDCPSLSWSTGTDTGVQSHYRRILAVNPDISGRNYNDAKTGAKIADLPGQAQTAVGQNAQYVTILIGANDACTSSESTMTPVATFRQRLDTALATLKAGVPGAQVLVVSIPDIKRLWEVGRNNGSARFVWSIASICQSMLANPLSNSAADNARRDRVRQRVVEFNSQLAAACTAYGPTCRYDGGAVFAYPFVLSQISGWDYFHPNAAGQRVLSEVTYTAGFGW